MSELIVSEANLRNALMKAKKNRLEAEKATKRNLILEDTLISVWRWSNDDFGNLETLQRILLDADKRTRLEEELMSLEMGVSPTSG